jgi:hypothetical protein
MAGLLDLLGKLSSLLSPILANSAKPAQVSATPHVHGNTLRWHQRRLRTVLSVSRQTSKENPS